MKSLHSIPAPKSSLSEIVKLIVCAWHEERRRTPLRYNTITENIEFLIDNPTRPDRWVAIDMDSWIDIAKKTLKLSEPIFKDSMIEIYYGG